jgi:hypothetical protein
VRPGTGIGHIEVLQKGVSSEKVGEGGRLAYIAVALGGEEGSWFSGYAVAEV